tara:strand:+ start:329 stop:457 length:129 start_codon:yes stop_codon:yes gene_type:complete
MKSKNNPDNDAFNPSAEYFKGKSREEEDDTYFPLEESKPPHY